MTALYHEVLMLQQQLLHIVSFRHYYTPNHRQWWQLRQHEKALERRIQKLRMALYPHVVA